MQKKTSKRLKLPKFEDPELIDVWNNFIKEVTSIEIEIVRSARGNVASGKRVRHGLMRVRKMINEMRKRTLNADKKRVEARKKLNEEKKK